MEIRRAYRERLYPTQEQAERLQWTLDQCRALYNAALEQRRHAWESFLTGQHLVPVPVKPEGGPRRKPRPVTPAQQRRRERARAKENKIDDGLMWRKGLSYEEQVHDLVDLKAGFPELADVNAQILQNVCKRVDLAYAAYLDRRAEYGKQCAARQARGLPLEPPPDPPHFKGKRHYNSFTNPNPFQGWKLEHGGRGPFPVRVPEEPRLPRSTARRQLNQEYGRLVLSNIGAITVRWSRPIEGTVKTVTIRREGNEWYVTWSCVLEVEEPTQPQRPAVGIDVGLASFATFDEDDSHIDNPRYYRQNEATLARRQRIVSTKVEAHRRETAAGKGSSLASPPLLCRKHKNGSGGPMSDESLAESPAGGASAPSGGASAPPGGTSAAEGQGSSLAAEPLRSRSEQLTGARRTNNLARARAQVAKAHRKAQRRREDFHHCEAKKLVERVGAIGVEALSIDTMVRRPKPKLAAEANGSGGPVPAGAESPAWGASAPVGGERRDAAQAQQPVYVPNGASAKSGLNKSINDAAWATFLFILEYKATAAGLRFVKVDPRGTSQVCSRCHKVVAKPLSERWHLCPHCGLSMPRDQNSACEIYQRAGFGIPPALARRQSSGLSPGLSPGGEAPAAR